MATKVITGKVRLSYANVWVPKKNEGGEKAKYSCALIIPKSDTVTLKKLEDAIEAEIVAGIPKFGGKRPPNATLKLPLRDGDAERPDDETYKDAWFINANSDNAPGIIGADKQEIINHDDVYSGCYAKVHVTIYPYNFNGTKGIACGLNNIMKVADGERLSGGESAEAAFADEEEEIS